MKFYIAVDCEGVACGVGAPGGSLNESANLELALLQATREANAAAQGLFAAGATEIIVWDAHSRGVNLHYDLLDERCLIALGSGSNQRLPGLDESFAGLLLIGYHAMDNTLDGVMCHTFSSATYQWMKVNGQEVGELAIDGGIAGERGAPVLFVASDDKGVAEGLTFFPESETYTTKIGLGWNAALSKHPARVVKEIIAAMPAVVEAAERCQPFRFPTPLELAIRHKRLETAEAASRRGQGWERVDAYTVKRTLGSLQDYF